MVCKPEIHSLKCLDMYAMLRRTQLNCSRNSHAIPASYLSFEHAVHLSETTCVSDGTRMIIGCLSQDILLTVAAQRRPITDSLISIDSYDLRGVSAVASLFSSFWLGRIVNAVSRPQILTWLIAWPPELV